MTGVPALYLLLLSVSSGHSKVLQIVGHLSEPYLMPLGNDTDKLTGFIPDLLDAIAEVEPFSYGHGYKMIINPTGSYGRKVDRSSGYVDSPDQKWTGMMGMISGQVSEFDIDVVAADMRMTSERMEDIDFSIPFIHTSDTILLKSPGLRWDLDRSLEDGGFSVSPKYAAQPTTIQQLVNSRNRGKDANTKFICIEQGSAHRMLQQSQILEHRIILERISRHENVVTNAEGLEKIKSQPGFGFVMDKMQAEYFASKDNSCRLYTVGQLQYYNYAFGFPKGQALGLAEKFSRGILKVNTNGMMFELLNKWFPKNQNCVTSKMSLGPD